MTPIPPSIYDLLARCLHEYQLSAKQEADLRADVGFSTWYAATCVKGQP